MTPEEEFRAVMEWIGFDEEVIAKTLSMGHSDEMLLRMSRDHFDFYYLGDEVKH